MGKILSKAVSMVLFGLVIVGNVNAKEDTHDHGQMKHEMDHSSLDMDQMFLEKRQIDAYDVSFHVMEATKSMHHGGSHNVMIKIEQKGKVVDGAKINSKIIYPDGKAESKMLMKMGDWYMAGYDLKSKGRHQMMILFKTKDGKKHKGGVYYPKK